MAASPTASLPEQLTAGSGGALVTPVQLAGPRDSVESFDSAPWTDHLVWAEAEGVGEPVTFVYSAPGAPPRRFSLPGRLVGAPVLGGPGTFDG